MKASTVMSAILCFISVSFALDSTLTRTTTQTYYEDGKLKTIGYSGDASQTSTYHYDSLGRKSRLVLAGSFTGIDIEYHYSLNGLIDSEVVVNHETIYYYYDDDQRLILKVSDTNDSTLMTYNDDGTLRLTDYRHSYIDDKDYRIFLIYDHDTLVGRKIFYAPRDTSRSYTQVFQYDGDKLQKVDKYNSRGMHSFVEYYSHDSLERVSVIKTYRYTGGEQCDRYILNDSSFAYLLPVNGPRQLCPGLATPQQKKVREFTLDGRKINTSFSGSSRMVLIHNRRPKLRITRLGR